MSKKATLPYAVRLECIAYVRGYPRRVRAYREARAEILGGTHSATEGMPRGQGTGRPAESKAEQLAAIENWPETKKMRAVEYAMENVGRDIANENVRRKLVWAIMRNCDSQKRYPAEMVMPDGMSYATFRRRKGRFLFEIAKKSGMIES